MDRYRNYLAWQEAMKMGLVLYRLADELPDEEQHLLASDLRRAAVEVPAVIAHNLMQGQPADLMPILKLQMVMELIAQVYPALDTAEAERVVNAMGIRMNDAGHFAETAPQPEPMPEPEDDEPEDEESDDDDYDEDDEADEQSEVHIGVDQG